MLVKHKNDWFHWYHSCSIYCLYDVFAAEDKNTGCFLLAGKSGGKKSSQKPRKSKTFTMFSFHLVNLTRSLCLSHSHTSTLCDNCVKVVFLQPPLTANPALINREKTQVLKALLFNWFRWFFLEYATYFTRAVFFLFASVAAWTCRSKVVLRDFSIQMETLAGSTNWSGEMVWICAISCQLILPISIIISVVDNRVNSLKLGTFWVVST